MKTRIFTQKEKDIIISLYNKGKGSSFINKIIKSSPSFILKFLRSSDITIRGFAHSNGRLFERNDNYFETIDSKDKAYFLGLMMADGNNFTKGIRIELHKQDLEILEKFKTYINYSGEIKSCKREKSGKILETVKLTISSTKLSEDCSKYNVVPNKTFKTKFPNIDKEFYSHFIRGYLDGDGSISKNNVKKGTWNCNVTGYIDLIVRIREILMEECNLNNIKIQDKGKKGICTYNIGGNIQTQKVREYLYNDCDDLYLTRKKKKFDSIESPLLEKKKLNK